ncbi:nuclear factor of activated T-cells 5 isoform X2 [Procambarus clarkii]|uniref:nuclear factor of activated T-cells 5 isoform X2 n=1 Tax=Procambarus clarkii TaxID=6728 RepID=UPI001E67108C|nr:nuclear factor of activated T-cells 5-like isoform X2 [Procambarus clarkii]
MGKVSSRNSLVSTRRRLIKASSGVGVKKSRGSAKVSLPPPPPPQSLVLDEDSGFGGDQSLDSESSLLSPPGTSSAGVASLPSVLPSLTMVPQAVAENKFNKNLHVDLGGEEAQELPASKGTTKIHSVPPLVSFRDVSLLSSLNPFQRRSRGACNASLLCVDGRPQPCGHSNKIIKSNAPHTPLPLNAQLSSHSSDGTMELKLISQPEEQHRARYQTEGSRGAVKDRSGLGHPTVKLIGYNKATVLQVFVGSDSGKMGPHMFYQVCRVSGKNSTPCKERRLDGTALIEASLDPETNMTMSCDCVGILKERNVDVEHRFKAAVSRGRKKSTKCRLVFRTFVTLKNGAQETLQVVSQPIACTQPPGVPEICRKSLNKCSVAGGTEMFIFGKNFLKDTVVIFQQSGTKSQPIWEEKVSPDKETLQPIHLIVTVPEYYDQSITEEVMVDVMVSSGGKTSECHSLTYVPLVIKRELPVTNKQDKLLPKGVSPCALQLNRHYAETGTLPTQLPEATAPVPSSHATSTTSVLTSATMGTSLQGSHLMLNSTPNKRASIRAPRSALRPSKTSLLPGRATTTTSSWSRMADTSLSSVSDVCNGGTEKKQEKQGKVQGLQGTVSLESLVEMLKVVQKFPSGSNIHTCVLQLVEELVKSMKKNISSPFKTEVDDLVIKEDVVSSTFSERMASNVQASDISSVSYLNKTQKLVPHSISLQSQSQPQETFANGNHSNNVVLPAATTVSLFPFTLLSAMPSTVSAGARVARVAPVAPVAPTTVVSSPGLTRTVNVCLGEAPNILEEPPMKKHCGGVLPMDYQLLRSNQFGQEQIACSSVSDTIVTQTPVSTTFNTVTPMLTKVVSNQHSSNDALSPPTVVDTQACRLDLSTSRVINSHHITETSVDPPLYQPISQSMIHNIGPTTTAVQHERQSINASQPVTQTIQQTTCLASRHQTNQTVSQSPTHRGQLVDHTNQQTMSVQSNLSRTDSDPLLSQSMGLCSLQANHVTVTTASPNQTILPSTSMVTSALTHSDPLLSQSSPVVPMHIDASSSASIVRTEPGNRSRDPLMTPNPATSQVSMQNEVTSAINLSETELLNYFDPNCFDNV